MTMKNIYLLKIVNMHKPDSVVETKTHKILGDFGIKKKKKEKKVKRWKNTWILPES